MIRWAYKLIHEIFKLDIYDLNFINGNPNSGYYRLPVEHLPKKGILYRIFSYGNNFFVSLGEFSKKKKLKISRKKFIAFSASVNQTSALGPVIAALDGDVDFFGINNQGEYSFPLFAGILVSIPFFPVLLVRYLLLPTGHKKLSYQYSLDLYWLSYGLFIVAAIFFRARKYVALIVTNDHLMYTRVLCRAANFNKVKTIYIQHASISNDYAFPRLEFDYALLEGIDAVKKYDKYGNADTKVFLIGMPKYDAYFPFIKKSKIAFTIGIAFNMTDEAEKIVSLVDELYAKNKFRLIVRPHPGDSRFDFFQNYCLTKEIEFSDSRKENSFVFLQSMSIVIAGDSNIVLEALLLNVIPIRYSFSKWVNDQYGFIKNKSVEYIENIEDLLNYLQRLKDLTPNVRSLAADYCYTVNTPFDGKSNLLIKKILTMVHKNQIEDFSVSRTGSLNIQHVYIPRNI